MEPPRGDASFRILQAVFSVFTLCTLALNPGHEWVHMWIVYMSAPSHIRNLMVSQVQCLRRLLGSLRGHLSALHFLGVANGHIRILQHKRPIVGPLSVDGLRVKAIAYTDNFRLMAMSPEDLQRPLDIMAEWCAMFGLIVSLNKTVMFSL